ncbi:carboxypeptidase-like regulatory domain-containing protein [Hymenobacter algoricola]|uniref:Carboxypeptidase-like regulatory domain-containing protein n=1 Tax=Hymenobacter algoricola TaxID=486267 RepID=A0ABP7MQ57_9BACT
MRFSYFLLLFSALSGSVITTSAQAQQQRTLASNAPYSAEGDGSGATDVMMLSGKITNPAGPLPGAVVILKGTRQMAVTNAEGQFQFRVPADAGALPAVVTYAGYADEELVLNAAVDKSTVKLSNARVIEVSRGQRLNVYLKHARKEAKRSLREVRE